MTPKPASLLPPSTSRAAFIALAEQRLAASFAAADTLPMSREEIDRILRGPEEAER